MEVRSCLMIRTDAPWCPMRGGESAQASERGDVVSVGTQGCGRFGAWAHEEEGRVRGPAARRSVLPLPHSHSPTPPFAHAPTLPRSHSPTRPFPPSGSVDSDPQRRLRRPFSPASCSCRRASNEGVTAEPFGTDGFFCILQPIQGTVFEKVFLCPAIPFT